MLFTYEDLIAFAERNGYMDNSFEEVLQLYRQEAREVLESMIPNENVDEQYEIIILQIMYYIYLRNNKIAVKTATCFFNNGNVELVTYDGGDNNISRNLVQLGQSIDYFFLNTLDISIPLLIRLANTFIVKSLLFSF